MRTTSPTRRPRRDGRRRIVASACWAIVACALLVSACADAGFETFGEISKLRVLGIRVEPPEIGPGDLGVVTALVASPSGEPLRYVWELCLVTDGPDGGFACAEDPESGEVAGAVIGTDPVAVVPYDLIVESIGTVEELCGAIADVELPDFVELPDCTRGYPATLRLTVEVGDGQGDRQEIAIKELMLLTEDIAADGDVNQNPRVDGLLVDEVSITGDGAAAVIDVPADGELGLRILVNADQAETYVTVEESEDGEDGEDVDDRERLSVSWFSTHGRFDDETTFFAEELVPGADLQTNRLDLEAGTEGRPGDEVAIFAVVRDDRGGASFATGRFEIGATENSTEKLISGMAVR